MSNAFDEWIDNLNESIPNRQNFSTGPVRVWMRRAFNAGLEAAALRVARLKRGYGSERHDETCTLAIEVIRALKEES